MSRADEQDGWTRDRLLRAAFAGGAVVAGGAATAGWSGGGAPAAAPSRRTDAGILNLFLLLEQVQEDLYREALRAGELDGPLRRYAATAGAQETKHVARLTELLGGRAKARPDTDFADAVSGPDRFSAAAIQLEEATISAYIAQAANLTRDAVAAIVPLISVEARQVAWIRDLAGKNPAPNAADPARDRDDVLNDLREGGFVQ